jgi:hypothetical protein
MSMRITGSDVKTATTTTATAGGAADGTVTFRDGSATASVLLIAPCNANDTETLNIPDSGVLFETGIHVVLSDIDRVTIFHS